MNGNLNANIVTIRVTIITAWQWWRNELADCVPQQWRARMRGRLALVPLDSIEAPRGQAIAVVLPIGAALCRTIETPAMAERDVNSMITLDARRLVPIGGDGTVIAARIVERAPATGRMRVELAAISGDYATRIANAIVAARRIPVRIYANAPTDHAPEPVDLLPALRRAGLILVTDRVADAAWLIVAFSFALNLGLLVWRDVASVDALSAMVEQQASAVGVAHRVVGRMRAQDRMVTQSLDARQTREPLLLMGRVASALPPGSWLRRFAWTGDNLRIAGFHRHGVDITGALRRAGFAVVRYGDAGEAATPMGEPFDATLGLASPGMTAH